MVGTPAGEFAERFCRPVVRRKRGGGPPGRDRCRRLSFPAVAAPQAFVSFPANRSTNELEPAPLWKDRPNTSLASRLLRRTTLHQLRRTTFDPAANSPFTGEATSQSGIVSKQPSLSVYSQKCQAAFPQSRSIFSVFSYSWSERRKKVAEVVFRRLWATSQIAPTNRYHGRGNHGRKYPISPLEHSRCLGNVDTILARRRAACRR